MPSNTREIKRRIKSVKNIGQITRAMQLVAASKMKRAEKRSRDSDVYAYGALEILRNVTKALRGSGEEHALLKKRSTGRVAVLFISTDRGFCGGLNVVLWSRVLGKIKEWKKEGKEVDVISVGKKGRGLAKKAGLKIVADFTGIGDRVSIAEIRPIARVAMEEFEKGTYEEVWIAYSQFVNTLLQRPVLRELLPVEEKMFEEITETDNKVQAYLFRRETKGEGEAVYVFEPNAEQVLKSLIPYLVQIGVYKAALEGQASEHSARMVAMKNATDKAGELKGDLELVYNQARQAGITREIAEISSGAAATA
ncbi:MAG: ATP synthase F1 subunit gamma [Nanoarchaeota archaeon]|nr:ATP synthase F1 subunit gamma [Nanoarchaeota archaeon]